MGKAVERSLRSVSVKSLDWNVLCKHSEYYTADSQSAYYVLIVVVLHSTLIQMYVPHII